MSIELNTRIFAAAARQEREPKEDLTLSAALEAIKIGAGPSQAELPQAVSALSLPCLDLAGKTEGIWECEKGLQDPDSPGRLYVFKLPDRYDDVTESKQRAENLERAQEQINALFPAIQKMGWYVLFLDPENKKKFIESALRYYMWSDYPDAIPGTRKYTNLADQLLLTKVIPYVRRMHKHAETLRKLGYGCKCDKNGVYLTLPDHTALLYRWEKLRGELPGLGALDVVSMDGKADAKTFLSLFLEKGMPLDSEAEFVHDHLIHVIPMIILMLESGTYVRRREKITYEMLRDQVRAYIRDLCEKREQIKKELDAIQPNWSVPYKRKLSLHRIMETLISALVDTLTSFDRYKKVLDNIHIPKQQMLLNLMAEPRWKAYLSTLFSRELLKAAKAELRARSPSLNPLATASLSAR